MLVLKLTSVALISFFLAVYFFLKVSLIMAILNTRKTRTDNVPNSGRDKCFASRNENKKKKLWYVYGTGYLVQSMCNLVKSFE